MAHAISAMIDGSPAEITVDQELLAECIQTCFDCAETCTACADACPGEDSFL